MAATGMQHDALSVTLASSIDEVRWRWNDREVPIRLHDAAFGEDGAPRLSAPFLRFLTASAFTVIETDETDVCFHPRLVRLDDPFACIDCGGMGVKTTRRERYAWPMWAALSRLAHEPPDREGLPPPAIIVLAVASSRWDWHRAAVRLRIAHLPDAEHIVARAFAKLRGRYQERPVPRVGWVSMSDSHMAQGGQLPTVRFGKSVRVPRAGLAKWIERNTR